MAKLRAKKTNENLLLLSTEFDVGHGGASGRYSRLEEVAGKKKLVEADNPLVKSARLVGTCFGDQ